MDTQVDTAQRGAEIELAAEEILYAINQLAYPSATIKRVVSRVIQQTRRAALEEAIKAIRARGDEYMRDCQAKDATGKKYRDTYEMRRTNSGRAWAFKDLADDLDRLREGV